MSEIVEVGTWKGLGTTLCIHNGISGTSKNALSIECDIDNFEEAKRNLPKDSRVRLVYGTLVQEEDLDREGLTLEEKRWFEQDAKLISQAPDVLSVIPSQIDLLVLDGGEFGSWAEFSLLEDRLTRWIALDDTLVRKNEKVHSYLLGNGSWTLADSGSDRHGWSVWKRV